MAERSGVESRVILELADWADLARVRGIAEVCSDLLWHAGVDTVKELATRNPDHLQAKLADINGEKKLAGRTPHVGMVKDWVAQAQAQALPKLLEY